MDHHNSVTSEAGKMAVSEEADTGLDSDSWAAVDYTLATLKVHFMFQLMEPGR